jgi:hypothetical protein
MRELEALELSALTISEALANRGFLQAKKMLYFNRVELK